MSYRLSRLVISCPRPSGDGRYYGRYPNGNNPVPSNLAAGGADSTIAAAQLSTSIKLAGSAQDSILVVAGLLTASSGDSNAITLAWTAPTQYSDGSAITDPITYNVYQAPGNVVDGPTSPPEIIMSGLTATSVAITSSISSGTLYYFEVTAVIDGVESTFTTPVYVTAP